MDIVGDKSITKLTREDIILFRDWWIKRIKSGMSANSANKDLVFVKNIIETLNENLNLEINTSHLFRKITIKEHHKQKRRPFTTDHIINNLLNPNKLQGLNNEGKYFLMVMSETRARMGEILGLLPEDICLDAEVPHINIIARPNRPLKTPYS
ncbi:MAG: hypothetical protein WBA74_00860 [Cyclobacteriaceae bacterium]